MKRRQKPIFSLLHDIKVEPPEGRISPDPQVPKPINGDISLTGNRPQPAPAPDIGYPKETSLSLAERGEAIGSKEREVFLSQCYSVRLSDESHDYGWVFIGEAEEWKLVVQNEGDRECMILELSGLPANGFSLLDPPLLPQTIPPHGAQTLLVRFTPDSSGKKTATLTITLYEQDRNILDVFLHGTGIKTIHTPDGVYHCPIFNSLGMSFIYIPPGSFMMGSPEHEPGRNSDETQHEVTLTKAFYIQTTPVTQGQWKALMGNNPSSFINRGDDCPVEQVSWRDCQEFIKRLSALGEGTYRLPTEAEWEYACRAGSPEAFVNGEIVSLFCDFDPNLDLMGWYCGNSDRHTHPVAQKHPNAWGLYDMHGNVLEWCQDWYGDYPLSTEPDPLGPKSGSGRVIRGGSWFSSAKNCRAAFRFISPPNSRSPLLGFRLVREPKLAVDKKG